MRTTRIYAIALVFACATALAETPEQIFKQVSPSIVVIGVSDTRGKAVGQGSGVVIGRDTVITNCHVAQAGAGLTVNYRGISFVATLRYADTDRDLCELSVPGLPAPAVSLASTASLQVGQSVYAIGAPEGLELTLSSGLISALRSLAGLRYIQTTAAISPGSSGGGLFDDQGRLVGITTFYMEGGENLNFALPADWIAGLPERAGAEARAATSGQARESDWIPQAVAAEEKSGWLGLLKVSLAWVKQEPDSGFAWDTLSLACEKLGQYDTALAADKEAVRLDPKDAYAWFSLGFGYGDLQQYDKALEADQEAVRLDPKNAEAWVDLGFDYSNLQQYDKALAADKEAVRLDPKDAGAWRNLGADYGKLQQYDKGLDADQEAVRLDPKNAQAWINLGTDYGMLDEDDKALAAHQEVVRLDPKDAGAWFLMGTDYCLLGRKDEAISVYQVLQKLDSSSAEKLFNLCILP